VVFHQHLRRLASESLIYGLSTAVARLVHLFLVPIYTRAFAPELYGEMSLVVTTMGLLTIFVVLGLDNSAHRWFWDTEDSRDRKRTISSWTWCQLTAALLLAGGVFLASDGLARAVLGREEAGLYFRIAVLALPLSTLSMVVTNWLRMQRRPLAMLGFNTGLVAVSILATVLLVVRLDYGIEGVFWAQVVTAATGALLAVLLMRGWLSPAHLSTARLAEMLRFALPLIPAAISFWIVNLADRYFIQYYVSASEVGLYQVGYAVASVVALVTAAFQQAWGPFALSIHRKEEAGEVYARVLPIYAWTTCLLATAVTVLAPEVLQVFATAEYGDARTVVGYLAFSYVMIGAGYIASLGPTIAKRTAAIGVGITAAAGLNLVLNFLLTPRFGKEGAAFATLLSQSLAPLYLFYRSQRIYPIPYRFGGAVGIVVFSCAVIAGSHALTFDGLWATLAAKSLLLALFVPALAVFGIIDLKQLLRALRARRAGALV
jgi:O-antigen/teichoic acid export membrane protein